MYADQMSGSAYVKTLKRNGYSRLDECFPPLERQYAAIRPSSISPTIVEEIEGLQENEDADTQQC